MSELKVMKFFEAIPLNKEGFYQPGAFVNGYLKSEADKVIAEKDKEIAELKEKFERIKDFVWKKASEELPKEKEIVLCLVENCGCYHYSMNYQENGEWSFPEDVAYWQRLPKEKEMKR